jgi:DNA repair protein RadD
MRPAPGKQHLVVLDHCGNSLVHGLPDMERKWTLDGVEKEAPETRKRATGTAEPVEIVEVEGELRELTPERLRVIRGMTYGEIMLGSLTEPELRVFAAHKGYKPGWVWHRMREQAEAARAGMGARA